LATIWRVLFVGQNTRVAVYASKIAYIYKTRNDTSTSMKNGA